MSRVKCQVAFLLATVAIAPLTAQQTKYDRNTPLPPLVKLDRETEIEMARAAAPSSVSDHATIWVVGSRGYEVARGGTNGWGCFVQRNSLGTGAFPRCDDPERVAALYPVYFLLEEYRARRGTGSDYDRAIADGFKSGKYRAPAVGAMSYMLAAGAIPPHVMVAVPGCKVQQLGLATVEQMRDTTLTTVFRGLGETDCDMVIFTPPTSRRQHSGVASGRSG